MTWNELLAWLVTAIVLPGLGLILRAALPLIFDWMRANIKNKDAARMAEGFAAGAGRIALDVVQAKQDDPNADIKSVIATGIKREGQEIAQNVMKDTAAKMGVSQGDVEKAVAGRLGPILAPAQAAISDAAIAAQPIVDAAAALADAAGSMMDKIPAVAPR